MAKLCVIMCTDAYTTVVHISFFRSGLMICFRDSGGRRTGMWGRYSQLDFTFFPLPFPTHLIIYSHLSERLSWLFISKVHDLKWHSLELGAVLSIKSRHHWHTWQAHNFGFNVTKAETELHRRSYQKEGDVLSGEERESAENTVTQMKTPSLVLTIISS